MKTDNYTKFMLTVIACCLAIIVFRDVSIVPTAKANESNYTYVPVNPDGSITVRFEDHNEIDVNISSISTNDELDINIDEVGGSWVSSGGPINVSVDD